MRILRFFGWFVAAFILFGLGLAAFSYWEAVSDPIVREADVALPDWPSGTPPIRALLISDIHVAAPDMPPSRLERIVAQINALHPDIVLIAGDLVSDKGTATRIFPFDEAVAPLAGLTPRLGVFAVMGNHDHERGSAAAHRALAAVHVTVIDNSAISVGPLALGGLNDDFSGHADVPTMLLALDRLSGARVLLSHSPDPFPDLPPDIGLMLAGHTHCGQIRLPWFGPLGNVSRYGERYNCGIKTERGHRLIVTAGVGTSAVPFRLGAPPDMWLVTLGPRARPN